MEAIREVGPKPRLSWRTAGFALVFGVAASAVASIITTNGVPFLSYNPFPEKPIVVAQETPAPDVMPR